MDEEDVVHIYNGILLSHKKNKTLQFAATWIQLEIIILSEVSQKKTNTIWYYLYVESKIWRKWNCLWNRLKDIKNRLVGAKQVGEGKDWEFGISRCRLLYIGWISNKVLLCSIGNCTHYSVINYNGTEYKRLYIYIYMYNRVTFLCSQN